MRGLLNGVNILDFGRGAVGPWAASLLGCMGANVIKVESPQGEDMLRQQPTQLGHGVAYTVWNANKKGMVLDLKSSDSRPHLERLVREADLVMENLTPEAMTRLGAEYESLRAINPHIVYASSPGWGYSGPMKDLPAGDPDFQAFSGFASPNGEEGGKSEVFRHIYPMDLNAAVLFASSAVLGIIARNRTGRSQWVSSTHLGSSILLSITRFAEHAVSGQLPGPLGSASGNTAPHEAFLCQDLKYLAIGVENDTQWRNLCEALRRKDLLHNPLWATNSERVKNRKSLSDELSKTFMDKPSRWWAIQMEKHYVPFGYFYDFETLRNHRQVTENEFILEKNVPYQGHMFMGGAPWKFATSEVRIESAPRHGEHTGELLKRGFEAFGTNDKWDLSADSISANEGPPLAGLRVVDVSQGLAGPYLSMLLADAGAEVIKVELPSGDYARAFAPTTPIGDSAAFLLLNRGKKSVTLDVESEEDIGTLQTLVEESDVFIEDWGPGKPETIGLGYREMATKNPGLVYCAISGFGEEGPFKNRPGSELVAQAYSESFLSLGSLDGPPLRVGADMANMSTGAVGLLGVLAAILCRQKKSVGERVAVSLMGTMMVFRQANWTSLGDPDEWVGGFAEPYGGKREFGYLTKDGRLYCHPRLGNLDIQGIATKIKEATGNLAYNAVSETGPIPMRLPFNEEYFRRVPSKQVKEILLNAGAQGVEINNIAEILKHPQTKAVGVVKEMDHPDLGLVKVLVKPWRGSWDDVPLVAPPKQGQHNAEFKARPAS